MNISKILICCLLPALFIGPTAVSGAVGEYAYSIDPQDVQIRTNDGLTSVVVPASFTGAAPGEPDLPVVALTYAIPSNTVVAGAELLTADTVLLASGVTVAEALPEAEREQTLRRLPYIGVASQSRSLAPGNVLSIANCGYLRGVKLVTLWVRPCQLSGGTGELFLITDMHFKLVLRDCVESPHVLTGTSKPIPSSMLKVIRNADALSGGRTSTESHALTAGDVPYIIITSNAMASAFQQLADWKTKKGCPAEVKTVESIATQYAGAGQIEKIRAYATDMYLNHNTEWVLLGGDIEVIPQAVLFSRVDSNEYFNGFYATDFYYSCLDYQWDENQDGLMGQPESVGDTVDFYPEVYIGRLPVSTLAEAQGVVAKLLNYEKNSAFMDYQTRALFSSTHFCDDVSSPMLGDFHDLSQQLQSQLPFEFTVTERYEQPSAGLITELNAGYGIISNYSHAAGHAENFLAYHGTYPGNRQRVWYYDVDTIHNSGRFGFFINSTCNNNRLDYVSQSGDTVCVGRSFILNPNGGGIGYLGSSNYNHSSIVAAMHQEFLRQIFSMGEPRPGVALAVARTAYIPQVSWSDNIRRVAALSNVLLGDPHLELWTETPHLLDITVAPTTLYVGTRSFTVIINSNGTPIEGATVCLRKAGQVYEIRTTDEFGRASFNSIYFPGTGTASLVASHRNCYPDESAISITNPPPPPPPPSCPMLFAWNGQEFVQEDVLLTACEHYGYRVAVTDYYKIATPIPEGQGSIRLELREMEDEITTLNDIRLVTVDHSSDTRIFCTTDGSISSYAESGIAPISVIDNHGVDQLELVRAEDSIFFSADEPGWLILTFPNDGATGDVIMRSAEKQICEPARSTKISTDVDNPGLRIEYLGADGSWTDMSATPSRLSPSATIVVGGLPHEVTDSLITIRLSWSATYTTDAVTRLIATNEDLVQRSLGPDRAAVLTTDVPSSFEPATIGGTTPIVLRRGGILALEFAPPPGPADSRIRDYVVMAQGRYEPDPSVYNDLLPRQVALYDNYPNPFNPTTTITFALPRTMEIRIEVLNVLGQTVALLATGVYEAGAHTLVWDANSGQTSPSGVYFYRLVTPDGMQSKKMLLLK